jgi:signal-transduction protein with cAMP-binding, CBS, and nucleotidyltransferase domain
MKVAELMTREVVAAGPGVSLKEAARLLLARGVSGLPIVDGEGRVLGVLSESDLVASPRAHVVGEAMSAPALTIESHRPAAAAAKLIHERRVNRLPVVDDGRLVGIVTRADLVRAFARTDAEIAAEIRDDVIERAMWLERGSVAARVDDGEVTLTGTVAGHGDAELVAALVGEVPGVVGVTSRLAWTDEG